MKVGVLGFRCTWGLRAALVLTVAQINACLTGNTAPHIRVTTMRGTYLFLAETIPGKLHRPQQKPNANPKLPQALSLHPMPQNPKTLRPQALRLKPQTHPHLRESKLLENFLDHFLVLRPLEGEVHNLRMWELAEMGRNFYKGPYYARNPNRKDLLQTELRQIPCKKLCSGFEV